jgi:hypothetical protein
MKDNNDIEFHEIEEVLIISSKNTCIQNKNFTNLDWEGEYKDV